MRESFLNNNHEIIYKEINVETRQNQSKKEEEDDIKWKIVWNRVVIFTVIHIFMLYAYYLIFTLKVKWQTTVFIYFYVTLSFVGVTAGAHRYWSHKSYKANLPMRILLMLMFTTNFQMTLIEWVRDHRTHHKFTDTPADPHNSNRGFFFSHIGWLMLRKHKDVKNKGKMVDMSDVKADPVIQFHQKYFGYLVATFCFAIPTLVPWYFWGESYWYALAISVGKWAHAINIAASVNSFAHMFGSTPYDRQIRPRDNWAISFLTNGEGWHNYHHVFPWDYKAAELGNYRLNFTTCFLDFMAKIGWVTELKTVSDEHILKRILRTGDSTQSHRNPKKVTISGDEQDESNIIWGWGDKDMNPEDIQAVKISSKVVT